MTKSSRQRAAVRSRAEEEFLAAQKKNKKELEEKERLRNEKAQHVADLKAKRLAKEAADKEEPAPPPEKPAKKRSPAKLPQFHRF
ncbi:MAG: hypothetical protein COW30_04270 [Rhodospirillales bacterium CG15_BIG_FIL_POST_REV_8_21_14_020_66_15]|nr:MAG: hypothetical protein COW30_04270 [Rhodospirillales bacterium CG15_BIG_FIL_POST_REV_8_21_14_020_66_15]